MKKETLTIDRAKFTWDSLANFMSVFILGVSGLVMNIVIARFYSAADLGVFNQVYAIYVLLSQLAPIGVQVSVIKHIAQYSHEKEKCNRVFTSAFFLCIISTSIVVSLLYISRYLIGGLLKSPSVVSALPYVLAGLWCFALNKLFMGVLNGFEHMKAYAFFSSLRGMGFLIGILGATVFRIEGYKLPIILSVTEGIVIVPLFIYSKKLVSFVNLGNCLKWIKIHLVFGIKSLSVGLVTELNSRVDVLILGVFTTDRIVGIYSIAAMLIEGIAQIPFVLRRIFDPKLTKLIYQNRMEEIRRLIKKGAFLVFLGMLPLCAVLVLVFPAALQLLTANPDFLGARDIFAILAVGVVIQSCYLPFSGLMVQGGYPGYQSLFILLLCGTNLILNLILIPIYGMYGAAAATAASFVFFVFYFKMFAFRLFKLKI